MLNPLLTHKFEDEILELIDTQDEYTRSDLQGIVTVLVNKIMQEGYEIISKQKSEQGSIEVDSQFIFFSNTQDVFINVFANF